MDGQEAGGHGGGERGLRLRELVKHYGAGEQVVRAVDGVSLGIAPGEVVALYGPSGSGKSTLMMIAAGLMAADRGRVLFDGRDLSRRSARDAAVYRNRVVGLISQEFHLIPHATALDNALIKLPVQGFSLRQARVRTQPWLDRVGLGARAHHTPDQLSMGERQRLSIARALAADPRLLLADEPTGSLDSVRTREVLGLLRDLCVERSMPGLIVTHDPEASGFADRSLMLRDGRLVEERMPAEPAAGSRVE